MADTKISSLTDGTTAAGTDRIPAARSPFGTGTNRYITPAYIAEYIRTLTQTLTNKTLTSPVLTTPDLGTPSALTLTNATGLPISTGVSGLGTGVATALAAGVTGSGNVALATSPTFVTPVLGAATGTSLSVTGALTAYSGTAIPAGGTTGSGIKFSSTSNFGVFFGSGAPTLSAAQGAIYLRSDGTSTTGVYTNTDGSTTWAALGGGGGTPGGSSGQVQYNNGGSFGGVSGITLATGTLSALAVTGGTVTSSTPILDATQTWNSGGTTFTGLKLNVTDTASAAASVLIDVQVGSSSVYQITKAGTPNFPSGTSDQVWISRGGTTILRSAATNGWAQFNRTLGITGAVVVQNDAPNVHIIAQNSTASTTYFALYGDAANTLALRNSANAQTFNWYFSYTDASNYTRGALKTSSGVVEVAAESAGTGTANIDLKLTTKGTGVVQYGTHSAIAAETVTGYITIKDAGGTTRKLAVVS